MPFSNDYGNQLLQMQFNGTTLNASYTGTNLYSSLHTADPGVAGTQATSEISYTGYARLARNRTNTTFWTVSGKTVSNADAHLFGSMSGGAGGTVTHLAIGELSTGAGKLLYAGAVTPNISVTSGVAPNFPIGNIVVTYT